ncbi:MAG: hypothetical protein KDC95_09800 [Planctomycetes bacterium]|nr:hypothetical protein [Planctomycetota bacterium]
MAQAFQKSWRGQLFRHTNPALSAYDDGSGWQVLCPLFPLTTPHDFYRQWNLPKVTRDQPASTALTGFTKLTLTNLWPWVSLGYKVLGEVVAFNTLGTCIDSHEEYRPKFRIVVNGSPVAGYEEIAPNAGLTVHATPNPIKLRDVWQAITGQPEFPEYAGTPLTTAFYQDLNQLAPMSYHRNNWRDLIIPQAPIVINSGQTAQIEGRIERTPNVNSPYEGFVCELDGYVMGYLE